MKRIRVFLDANILFSAAWSEQNGLLRLWQASQVDLITSDYAIEEAERNLPSPDQVRRLHRLARSVQMINPDTSLRLPAGARARPQKDQPILQAAITAKADVLLTGDQTHFGKWFGRMCAGVRISRPGPFIHSL